MIAVDGSFGEGGGQILRTSLALSLATGRPFRIENIRAGRKKPGLLRQHLTALRAAAEIGRGQVLGDEMGSEELTFTPGEIAPDEYRYEVGTAGSATLVLQTVLPALLTAGGRTHLTLGGGTHNPFAPPFDFLERAFLPQLRRMGPAVEARLERPGFYPAGGGEFTVSISPAEKLARVDLLERGEMLRGEARALVASLSVEIAKRELKVVGKKLSWGDDRLHHDIVRGSRGPGNIVIIEMGCEHVTEVFTGFGQRGVAAEKVADDAARAARQYLAAGVPVGKHLADQLLVPMALAGGGSFRTLAPSRHTLTNVEVVKTFLDVDISVERESDLTWKIDITG